MQEFKNLKCTPCRGDEPPLNDEKINELLSNLPNWSVTEYKGVKVLERDFKFKDFLTTLDFVNKIAKISEEMGHHPEITFTWGKASIRWWTHKIRGLHLNDFIMAAKTSDIYKDFI
ncbi:MAG: 4a-hydroxytetrahydrobiopterin dehydratase [bacterium]|nr:4a-hydroxytetrahydrobiopterin dehydratase [bacterium]